MTSRLRVTQVPVRRLLVPVALALTLVLIGSLGHAAILRGATAHEAANRRVAMRIDGGMPPRAVLISDSAISGIRWYGRQEHLTGTRWETYLESCRRLVVPSCRGREGYAPRTVVGELHDIRARLGPADARDLLVIAVGYNDSESRFRSDVADVLTAAHQVGFRRVVWLTYRVDNSYLAPGSGQVTDYGAMNAVLRHELDSGRWASLGLWDYNAAFAGHDEWFSSDGIHVTPDGATMVAKWLSGQLLRPLP